MIKLLKNKRGENYIDTVVGVVAAMMVIVVALNIFSFLTLKQDLDYYAKEMVKVDYYGGTPMERMQNITFFRKRVKTLDNPKAL